MRKKYVGSLVCVLFISLVVSSVGFALELPPGFSINQDISDAALTAAKEQFIWLKAELIKLSVGMPADQKAKLDQVILLVDDRLNNLDRIEVYMPDPQEGTPGEKYDDVYNFYQGKLQEIINLTPAEVLQGLTVVSMQAPNLIPPGMKDSLEQLVNEGKVKGVAGYVENTRVSISTVYVDYQTLQVIAGTTIVAAFDK